MQQDALTKIKCSVPRRYANEAKAAKAAWVLNTRGILGRKVYPVYCGTCKGYHLKRG